MNPTDDDDAADWLAECRERAPEFSQSFADHLGQGRTLLVAPGCPKGCPRCVRECAVRYIMADWWSRAQAEAEKAAVGSASSFVLEGVTYSSFGRA